MEDEMLRGRGTSLLELLHVILQISFLLTLSLRCFVSSSSTYIRNKNSKEMKIVVAYDSSTSHFSTFFCKMRVCVCVNVKRIKCAFKLENRKWRFRFCLQLNSLSLAQFVFFWNANWLCVCLRMLNVQFYAMKNCCLMGATTHEFISQYNN